MLTAFSLIPYFLVPLTLVSLIVLFFLAHARPLKIGYQMIMLSYVAWVWLLYAIPDNSLNIIWIYALPLAWLIVLFRFGFSKGAYPAEGPPQLGEPRYTQEALRGSAGTQEALRFYFLLLFIGLVLLQLILFLAGSHNA
jgi:hypothetical protein